MLQNRKNTILIHFLGKLQGFLIVFDKNNLTHNFSGREDSELPFDKIFAFLRQLVGPMHKIISIFTGFFIIILINIYQNLPKFHYVANFALF